MKTQNNPFAPVAHSKETVIDNAINELLNIKANIESFDLKLNFFVDFNRFSPTKSIWGLLTGFFKSPKAIQMQPKIYENLGLQSNELGGNDTLNHTALEKVMSDLSNERNNAIFAYLTDKNAKPNTEHIKRLLA